MDIPRRYAFLHPIMEPPGSRPPGPWWWRTDSPTATARPVWMCCPFGHVGTLADHEIAADGAVTPSVQCPPENACAFHESGVRLLDWVP